MSVVSASSSLKKSVWGRNTLTAVFIALFAVASVSASSAGPAKKAPKKPQYAKLDQALNSLVDAVGDSDVVIEFNDDSDAVARITANGGRSGRKLGIINGRAARISNALLKRLADDPKVKRIHIDRDVTADIARTSATVGAKNVQAEYGYSGYG